MPPRFQWPDFVFLSQCAAMKQLVLAVRGSSNQSQPDDIKNSQTQELLFDAVIGQEMVQSTLEMETQTCEQDFQLSYNEVIRSLQKRTRRINETDSEQHDQAIVALVDSLGFHDCPDDMLRVEVIEEFRQLYDQHQNDRRHYEQEFRLLAAGVDAAGSMEAACSKTGGWSDADEERFLKVLRSFERKGDKKPQLLHDQLLTVLPNVSLKEIKRHVRFHYYLRFWSEKDRDRAKEFERRSQELQQQARAKLQSAIQQEQIRQQKRQQLQEQQRQCDHLRGKVIDWKVTKDAEERIAKQQQEIERVFQLQNQQEEEQQWKKRHERQKLLVEDYKYGYSEWQCWCFRLIIGLRTVQEEQAPRRDRGGKIFRRRSSSARL